MEIKILLPFNFIINTSGDSLVPSRYLPVSGEEKIRYKSVGARSVMERLDPDRFHFGAVQSDPQIATGYESDVEMKFEILVRLSITCGF